MQVPINIGDSTIKPYLPISYANLSLMIVYVESIQIERSYKNYNNLQMVGLKSNSNGYSSLSYYFGPNLKPPHMLSASHIYS